jgi:WD40 repeat protein
VEGARSLLYLSMRRVDFPNGFPFSEDIPRRCWIQIGVLTKGCGRKHRSLTSRNPFNDSIIASGSDDGKVFIWQVPQGFSLHSGSEDPEDVAPVSKLTGHSRYAQRSTQREMKTKADTKKKGWTGPF